MTDFTSKIINLETKKVCLRFANEEWKAIDLMCKRENIKRNELLQLINKTRTPNLGLTNSVRLFLTAYLFQSVKEKQHPQYNKEKHISPIFNAVKVIL
jgi:predicted DNA-binding ribbon-helix-helix protein